MTPDPASLAAILRSGDLPSLLALQAAGVPLVLEGGMSALTLAAAGGHTPIVELLLAAGADPTEARGNAFTALHGAAMHGHTEAARCLLSAGANPNAQTSPQGYSPLHSAAFAGHEATVRLLIDSGALLGLRNYRDETPADTARRTHQMSTVSLLDAEREAAPARIAAFAWGRIESADGRVVKDARLFPGGMEAWDWNRTGTRHVPGIQVSDLEDLLAYAPTTVILSRGVNLVLEVPLATIDAVSARGPEVLVLQTEAAVLEYNRRVGRERVVALLHSTC